MHVIRTHCEMEFYDKVPDSIKTIILDDVM